MQLQVCHYYQHMLRVVVLEYNWKAGKEIRRQILARFLALLLLQCFCQYCLLQLRGSKGLHSPRSQGKGQSSLLNNLQRFPSALLQMCLLQWYHKKRDVTDLGQGILILHPRHPPQLHPMRPIHCLLGTLLPNILCILPGEHEGQSLLLCLWHFLVLLHYQRKHQLLCSLCESHVHLHQLLHLLLSLHSLLGRNTLLQLVYCYKLLPGIHIFLSIWVAVVAFLHH
ncbi:hypothetical protein V8G54_016375 [Vigna mungo]|uniref:Uncharacterized protein n=1 Tax=Vigna mungo TaxID=3915 RepID=A0AAQ3NMU9_VIGMU